MDYISFINFDVSKNIEQAKHLERPLNWIEKFNLSRKKKDGKPVNAVAADFFLSSFLVSLKFIDFS